MADAQSRSSIRLTVTILVGLVLLILVMVVVRQLVLVPQASEPAASAPELSELQAFVYEQGRPVADFSLQNEEGETVSNAMLQGHWTVAFVGYTSCPDVCPATLSMLLRAGEAIPADVPAPDVLLVSADPERDSPRRLKDYLGFFGPQFHGVTGDLDGLRELAHSLNAAFSHRTGENGEVTVDHSAHLALINPQGEMTAVLQPPFEPGKVAQAYERVYRWAHAQRG
ncbi:SCO family protein [Marinobacter bohaiensis]|uniref:SCO family protein n=1 Tax=Marinobacter bohaiensis TaxID=2201898 RepID=UPI000DAE80AC|nr:SCO family protein [Marinobacter bohaiensis]